MFVEYVLTAKPVNAQPQLVLPGDYIYDRQDFDSSPIVLESHKLIYFPVTGAGDTTMRCLIRRIMGYSDWYDPTKQYDGLRYLYHYDLHQANAMMTSPDYIRAIFVRDPKQRLLANWLQKVVHDDTDYISKACCARKQDCVEQANRFLDFVHLTWYCDQPFWRPQGKRMEPKYYERLNFVGHFLSAKEDAERLLQRIGLWDSYGLTGWRGIEGSGSDCDSIFCNASLLSKDIMQKYYTTAELEKKVETIYSSDYGNKYLDIKKSTVTSPNTTNV